MPKIFIRESDPSTAGRTLASNFSVFIAGPVASGKGVEGFDSNGVCLCKSISDFNQYIGKVSETASAVGVPPVLKDIKTSGDTPVYKRHLTQTEFYRTFYDMVYIEEADASVIVDGYLKKVGYKYTKAELDEWAENTNYCVIEPGCEGRDAGFNSANGHGNKMAYKLLNLGYTIYYKKFTSADISCLSMPEFWECAKDKSLYDFRYITHGLVSNTLGANTQIANVAQCSDEAENPGRGECIALLEIEEEAYTTNLSNGIVKNITSAVSVGNTNSAYFAPYVMYNLYPANDAYYSNKFPACFHYLACASKAKQRYAEWYAVAGYTRGVSDYVITDVGYTFGDNLTAKLQPRVSGGIAKAVNLIISLPQGYFIWGNRTAEALTGNGLIFSHFLNIRQTCCTLKKQIYSACKALTYDPNSEVLWLNFCGAIRPLLERMKADQGIKDYAFEKLTTEMKGKMFAAVRIVPIEAVEDFEIVATLEDNLDNPTIEIAEQLRNY